MVRLYWPRLVWALLARVAWSYPHLGSLPGATRALHSDTSFYRRLDGRL